MSPSTSIAFSASSIPWYSWSANVTFHILLHTCSSHTSAVPRLYEFCLRSFNVQILSLPILKIFDSVTRKTFCSPLVKAQPSISCQLLGYSLLYVPNLEYPCNFYAFYSLHNTYTNLEVLLLVAMQDMFPSEYVECLCFIHEKGKVFCTVPLAFIWILTVGFYIYVRSLFWE